MKLLLAEDEIRMANALTEILRMENYDVTHVKDGESALTEIETDVYDIIILDVMMPGQNGFDVARAARKSGIKTPILMLTAKDGIDDKVQGLDSGADDYLTKPFMTKELLARLRALARRSANSADSTLSFGDLQLSPGTAMLVCTKTGLSVRLGEKEYRIMELLMINQGQIMTREQLLIKTWGYNNDAEYNNVEVYMSFTRRKLLFIGSETEIKAVRGIGYELRCKNV